MYLSDYEDSPYFSLGHLEPTSNVPLQDPSSIITAQHVHKLREQFNKLEKIAAKSVQSTKYAICGIIEVTNRLGS